uniref:Uncharacterized protein n=1 Tax=Helianthus annuus TaxID=4232 RepID=A0A251VF50_HELAN
MRVFICKLLFNFGCFDWLSIGTIPFHQPLFLSADTTILIGYTQLGQQALSFLLGICTITVYHCRSKLPLCD